MKNILKKSASILFTCLCVVQLAHAQQSTINNYLSNGTYNFNGLDKYYQDNFFVTHRTSLDLTTDDNIELQNCHVDSNNYFHCRYTQKYKNYPVEGPSFVLHGQNGVVLYAHGNLAKNLNLDVTSPIAEDSALNVILDSINAHSYKWEDTVQQNILKDMADDSTYSMFPQGKLCIIPVLDGQNNLTYRFVWKFQIHANFWVDSTMVAEDTTINYEIYSDSLMEKVIVAFVDAKTGAIVRSYDGEDHGYGTGTGLTRYDGWQYIKTWKCGTCTDWRLRGDYGVYYATTWSKGNLANSWRLQRPLSNNNNFNGTNSEPILSAVSTHWAVQTSWEYFVARHNWHGSDGAGQKVYSYVHLDKLYASTYEDWGADVISVGKFYDGYSPATIDIIGHEYTHNFIRRNPKLNLNRNSSEAGALNEGYADIFGILIKDRQRGYINWHIGEDVRWNQNISERAFNDPHSSKGPQPAKYQEGGYWINANSNEAWHKNAGVLTHWFYLLVSGGTYNGITVTGIGVSKAERISFNTMMYYLQENSDYSHARNQTQKMAADYYGLCSPEYKAVNRAWAAVGVGSVEQCKYFQLWTGKPVLAGSDLATVNAGFKVINTSGVSITPSSYTWLIPSSWTGTYANSNSEFTLDETTDYNSKEIKVVVAYVDENDVNRTDTLSAITHFEEAQAKNYTGTGSIASGINYDEAVKIYPNPIIGNAINIELPNSSTTSFSLYSVTGVKVKSLTLNSVRNHINLDGIAQGVYILKIENKDFKKVERVVIQ